LYSKKNNAKVNLAVPPKRLERNVCFIFFGFCFCLCV